MLTFLFSQRVSVTRTLATSNIIIWWLCSTEKTTELVFEGILNQVDLLRDQQQQQQQEEEQQQQQEEVQDLFICKRPFQWQNSENGSILRAIFHPLGHVKTHQQVLQMMQKIFFFLVLLLHQHLKNIL
jgi:hypothetical protein